MTKPRARTLEDYELEVQRAREAFKTSHATKGGASLAASDRYAKALNDLTMYKRLTRRK